MCWETLGHMAAFEMNGTGDARGSSGQKGGQLGGCI